MNERVRELAGIITPTGEVELSEHLDHVKIRATAGMRLTAPDARKLASQLRAMARRIDEQNP